MGDPRNERESAFGMNEQVNRRDADSARHRHHLTPGRGHRAGFWRRMLRRIIGGLT